MRRRHKLFYGVQDWPALSDTRQSFWWVSGTWQQDIQSGGRGTASSDKECRNLRAALRCARQLTLKGGTPLVSRRKTVRGKRAWLDFYIN